MQITWKDFEELTESEQEQAKERAASCGYKKSEYPKLAFQMKEDRVHNMAHKMGEYITEKFY